MSGSRAPWLVAVAVSVAAAGVVVGFAVTGSAGWGGVGRPAGEPGVIKSSATNSGPVRSGGARSAAGRPGAARSLTAVEVLRDWDRARARAYAAGDVARLRMLYAAGARAGLADARMLRSYTRRGLQVEGMRMQLLAVRVLAHAPRRWRLRVTDRLYGAVAVDAFGGRLVLPRDQASTRVVTLVRRSGGRWQVAAVVPAPPPG